MDSPIAGRTKCVVKTMSHVSASGEVQSAKTPLHWPNKDISPVLLAHWSQCQPAGIVSTTLFRFTAVCSKSPMLVLNMEGGVS